MKVLILEDDPFLQIDIVDMITDLGHDVVGPFKMVAKAIESCRKSLPDAAFLDFNLGDDGQKSSEVADYLVVNDVPFAFTTGYSRRHLPKRYDAIPLVEKPFSQTAFEGFLKTWGNP